MKKLLSILSVIGLLMACSKEDSPEKEKPAGAVDLGLSVCWASCNVGASSPEDYGDFYAWGETEAKEDYSWSEYKFGQGSSGPFSKYNTNESYGNVDDNTVLDLEDDVAQVRLGGSWRMPTDEEFTELREKCKWEWMTQNGVYGVKVTGPNGNSIFIPAAGDRSGTSTSPSGSFGLYWSSSLNTEKPSRAYLLAFYPSTVSRLINERCGGRSVRPVSE